MQTVLRQISGFLDHTYVILHAFEVCTTWTPLQSLVSPLTYERCSVFGYCVFQKSISCQTAPVVQPIRHHAIVEMNVLPRLVRTISKTYKGITTKIRNN